MTIHEHDRLRTDDADRTSLQALVDRLNAEVGKALAAFAKEREIGILFDVAKLNEGIISAAHELDVTNEFIAYYNALHP